VKKNKATIDIEGSKRRMNKQRGITLVSLVVTIIVLIILAGVSINAILGENGIITMVKQAKENVEQSQIEEQTQLNELYMQIEEGDTSEGISYDAIAKLTEFKKIIAKAITNKGITTNETDSANIMAENIEKLQNDIGIKGPVDGGNYDNPYIPSGFIHINGEGTWNSGYIIKDITTWNEFVWVPCVLDQSKIKEGDKVEIFKKTLPTTTSTTDIYNRYNSINLTITGEEGTSANELEESVEKYGGFYIARYEAGIEGVIDNYNLSTKVSSNGSIKPLSKAGKGVWNYISRADAITISANMINNSSTIKTALISGAAWDTTLQWMVNSSENATNEPNINYDTNSKGKGWYNDVSPSDTRHITGYYAINNIYDMAGNVWEYTTENCKYNGNNYGVLRGCYSGNDGSVFTAAVRSNINSTEKTAARGFRAVLYKS